MATRGLIQGFGVVNRLGLVNEDSNGVGYRSLDGLRLKLQKE